MWDRIKQFFVPPVFEGDEELQRIARLLNVILWAELGIVLASVPLLFVTGATLGALLTIGGLLGLVSKVSWLRGAVNNDRCIECARCARACPTGAIDAAQHYASDPSECIMCLECVPACASASQAFRGHLKPAGRIRLGRVDALTGADESHAVLVELAHKLGEVREGTGEPVQLDHHDHVEILLADPAHHQVQRHAARLGAGHDVGELGGHGPPALLGVGAEFLLLGLDRLVVGRDAVVEGCSHRVRHMFRVPHVKENLIKIFSSAGRQSGR